MGKKIFDVVHPDDKDKIRKEVLSRGRNKSAEPFDDFQVL